MVNHPIKSVHVLSDDFQWLTPKHIEAVDKAASSADLIMFLVADADAHRSIVSPFTFEERSDLIKAAFPQLWNSGRISIVDVPSQLYTTQPYGYDFEAIDEELYVLLNSPYQKKQDIRVTVQGREMVVAATIKPEWLYIDDEIKDLNEQITSLDNYFSSNEPLAHGSAHSDLLDAFKKTDDFVELQHEYKDKHFILKNFGEGPFHTADAICTIDDQVLLITRKKAPYRHTLATPGGLLDPGEDAVTAAIRELLEETEMRVPSYVLTGEPTSEDADWVLVTEDFLKSKLKKDVQQFTNTLYNVRDPRGDYRANALWFDLSGLPVTPRVLGKDDAEKANWASKDDLTTSSMAFDHFAILCSMGVTSYPKTLHDARLKNETTTAPTL
jgi:bifunctional NMN adenylyltransferase/nudix hydrolase